MTEGWPVFPVNLIREMLFLDSSGSHSPSLSSLEVICDLSWIAEC
jgi:hypothetical protein